MDRLFSISFFHSVSLIPPHAAVPVRSRRSQIYAGRVAAFSPLVVSISVSSIKRATTTATARARREREREREREGKMKNGGITRNHLLQRPPPRRFIRISPQSSSSSSSCPFERAAHHHSTLSQKRVPRCVSSRTDHGHGEPRDVQNFRLTQR